MPVPPAVQQEQESPAKRSQCVPNYVMHFHLSEGKPHLTPAQLGSHVIKSVKATIGDNLSILMGQVTSRLFSN